MQLNKYLLCAPLLLSCMGMTFSGVNMAGVKNAAPKKIMCIGDSITNGNETGLSSSLWFGYRSFLQDALTVNAYDFIGPYSGPTNGNPAYDRNHSAVSGEQTASMLSRLSGNLTSSFTGESNYSDSWVLIHAGTNDCIQSATCDDDPTSPAVQNISDMIDTINAFNTNINIMVALIIPSQYSVDVDARIEAFNPVLKAMLDTKRGSKSNLHYVDMNAIFKDVGNCSPDYTACLSDTVHPNSSLGYPLMATSFYNCMTNPLGTNCDGN